MAFGAGDAWLLGQILPGKDAQSRNVTVTFAQWQRTPAGYFDRKVMVRFDDGLVGEVQFWPPRMLETKEKKGHALYEAWQRAMPGPEKAKLLGAQVALYGMIAAALPQAWHAVNFAPAT